jgi:hypothetical protein
MLWWLLFSHAVKKTSPQAALNSGFGNRPIAAMSCRLSVAAKLCAACIFSNVRADTPKARSIRAASSGESAALPFKKLLKGGRCVGFDGHRYVMSHITDNPQNFVM